MAVACKMVVRVLDELLIVKQMKSWRIPVGLCLIDVFISYHALSAEHVRGSVFVLEGASHFVESVVDYEAVEVSSDDGEEAVCFAVEDHWE